MLVGPLGMHGLPALRRGERLGTAIVHECSARCQTVFQGHAALFHELSVSYQDLWGPGMSGKDRGSVHSVKKAYRRRYGVTARMQECTRGCPAVMRGLCTQFHDLTEPSADLWTPEAAVATMVSGAWCARRVDGEGKRPTQHETAPQTGQQICAAIMYGPMA